MIGLHIQQPVPNWTNGITELPRRAVCPVVNDYFLARDIKAANSATFTVFRKWWDNHPQWGGDYQEEKRRARLYFDSFIDGTWLQNGIWQYVDGVKELNEYNATSNSEAERLAILVHLQAWCDVWNSEYRGTPKVGGRDIPLVCLSTPVGNDIDWRYARVITETGNVISYHGYTLVQNGMIGGAMASHAGLDRLAKQTRKLATGHVIPLVHQSDMRQMRQAVDVARADGTKNIAATAASNEWAYFSGRWAVMDAQFKARGIRARWIATEGGPFAGVLEGWRHPSVYNGNLERYAGEFIPYQLGKIKAWNQANGDRFIGSTLFTVGSDPTWQYYHHDAGQMVTLARAIRDHTGSPPPPPEPPPPSGLSPAVKEQLWQASVDEQIERGIRINPHATLGNAIAASGMQIVTNEITVDGYTIQAAETADGSIPRRVFWWQPGGNTGWFPEP